MHYDRMCVFVCGGENRKHARWQDRCECVWAVREKQSGGSTHGFIDWFLDRQTKNNVGVCWHTAWIASSRRLMRIHYLSKFNLVSSEKRSRRENVTQMDRTMNNWSFQLTCLVVQEVRLLEKWWEVAFNWSRGQCDYLLRYPADKKRQWTILQKNGEIMIPYSARILSWLWILEP